MAMLHNSSIREIFSFHLETTSQFTSLYNRALQLPLHACVYFIYSCSLVILTSKLRNYLFFFFFLTEANVRLMSFQNKHPSFLKVWEWRYIVKTVIEYSSWRNIRGSWHGNLFCPVPHPCVEPSVEWDAVIMVRLTSAIQLEISLFLLLKGCLLPPFVSFFISFVLFSGRSWKQEEENALLFSCVMYKPCCFFLFSLSQGSPVCLF